MWSYIVILIIICETVASDNKNESLIKILMIYDDHELNQTIQELNSSSLNNVELTTKLITTLKKEQFCAFQKNGYNAIIHVSSQQKSDWMWKKNQTFEMAYVKIDLSIVPVLKILDCFLTARNASEVVILFGNLLDVESGFTYFINHPVRFKMFYGLANNTSRYFSDLYKIPSFYVFIGSTQRIMKMLQSFNHTRVMQFPDRIVIASLDCDGINEIKTILTGKLITVIRIENSMSCFNWKKQFLEDFLLHFTQSLLTLNINELNKPSISNNCSSSNPFPVKLFNEILKKNQQNIYTIDDNILVPFISALIEEEIHLGVFSKLAKYNSKNGMILQPQKSFRPSRGYYRIATGFPAPWVYKSTDPATKQVQLLGYCIDLTKKLGKLMNFDYEFGFSTVGYGARSNKTWDGLIGGLIDRNLDMAISPMTITAEREESIDFIVPIFTTTGLSIVTREPVKKLSFFKFLTVLDLDVWLIIFGSLITTGFILFVLERLSPFSSTNTRDHKNYRNFTFTECFWFALTSFTPHGGGEPPVALSGRIFVAFYWIFVVLLLTTFTANLSAFLTVERLQMQPPNYKVNQLFRQTKVKFTVVQHSWSYAYFDSMLNVEKLLFQHWSKVALKSKAAKFRVWKYPINQIYDLVMQKLLEYDLVKSDAVAYNAVLNHTDGDFALIHDINEIRYEIARRCFLVNVGEVFAVRPYGLATQQGSILREQLANQLIKLRKEGFFDKLEDKYWGNHIKGECPLEDTGIGISVENLAGVFILTITILISIILTIIIEFLNSKFVIKKR